MKLSTLTRSFVTDLALLLATQPRLRKRIHSGSGRSFYSGSRMMIRRGLVALSVALSWIGSMAHAQTAEVARGDYLVNRVVTCGSCHTPRDEQHQPIAGKELSGAPLGSGYAPGIAGLPAGRSATDVSLLLQTGVYPDGQKVRPPMPQFRWNKADADAGAAYLASLKH